MPVVADVEIIVSGPSSNRGDEEEYFNYRPNSPDDTLLSDQAVSLSYLSNGFGTYGYNGNSSAERDGEYDDEYLDDCDGDFDDGDYNSDGEMVDSYENEKSTDSTCDNREKLLENSAAGSDCGNDSSYTVRCGWVILFSTWMICVFGLGSMFGVWKWVWAPMVADGAKPARRLRAGKVNEESDFPIEEYYPSMIMLLCIVAWIWCIVSWVGMKLFRHAKGGVSSDAIEGQNKAISEAVNPATILAIPEATAVNPTIITTSTENFTESLTQSET
ncbi:hypothetical protein V1511DRAFT_504065 [Dipodascopsis uninucleata]